MKRIFLYSLLSVFAFLILLAYKTPSSFLISQLASQTGMVYMDTIKGSLFDGSANNVQLKLPPGILGRRPYVLELGTVQWRIGLLSLLTTKLDLQLDTQHLNQSLNLNLKYGLLSGDVSIVDSQFSAALPFLLKFYPVPAKIDGQIELDIQALAMVLDSSALPQSIPPIDALQAQVIIKQLNVAIKEAVDLGDFGVNLIKEADQLIASASDINSSVSLEGRGTLSLTEQNYQLNAEVKPKPEAPAIIGQSLGFMARKQPDGTYNIKYSGKLN